jgi:hypothetical protein
MTPEERRQLVYKLESIVVGARLVLNTSLTQLRKEQKRDGSKCDPLVTSLKLVDGTLANAEQALQTIAKWEIE